MQLCQRLREYVAACFTAIWLESHEHDDALSEIAQLCRDENWRLATWDIDAGLRLPGEPNDLANAGTTDPLAAVRSMNALAAPNGAALLVLVNLHRFLNSAEIVQALARQISQGKQNRTFVLVLSPVVQVPTELEKLFVCIEHELPDRAQLEQIAQGIATEEGELPDGSALQAVLDASVGLTRYEAEGAFSLSLVRDGTIRPEAIWELKSQTLKKSGLLRLHSGVDDFTSLGGLKAMKAFCKRSLLQPFRHDVRKRPRGVLLLGIPGTGKSAFAKALGRETGRPTLVLDVGSLMGSLVGETERNVRQTLRIADAMAPCILFVDEVEKALSGAANSGQTDSGVSSRLFASLLTWLNDHESDVYFIGTCNDISRLPPEFARAERFDGIFFLDLPADEEKRAIWKLYLEWFGLDSAQVLPADQGWTGAEIRSCCRLAALLDLPLAEAARNIVPVAVTAAESVQRLRSWAHGRCLSAIEPGIYINKEAVPVRPARKIRRDPSAN